MMLPFQRAYVERPGSQKTRPEESLVMQECARLGIETVPYLAKQIHRRQLPLTREDFICGDMDAMHGAMKMLGIEVPVPNDFPASLEPFFRRRIWRSTFAAMEASIYEGQEVFAKPAGRRKLFTGRVFSPAADLYFLSGISRREPVWCSEVVQWISEFRVYVIEAEIVAVDHYAGDAAVTLSPEVLRAAIDAYTASGEAPAAYGIDFGVLSSGGTALVEANEGYALGAYAIAAEPYTRLLFTRWRQLVQSAAQTGEI